MSIHKVTRKIKVRDSSYAKITEVLLKKRGLLAKLNTRDKAKNGAQTKRVRVLIGSQSIGRVQIKRARTLHGSHISPGNEVTYTDPLSKEIYGDENNVCF